jgi:hypothetical protein
MGLKRLVRNRDFLFVIALLLGLFWGQGAKWTERTVIPVWGLVMTLARMGVSGSIFLSPGKMVHPALWGIALNYGVLVCLILALSGLFISARRGCPSCGRP